MKICFYIRLSSADDDLRYKTESESISNQRALLTQFVKSYPEFAPYEIIEFVDDGFSGTNGNRPSFERMIEYLKDGKAKLVICKDLSRFFRDYVEIGDYLERIFPFLGVRFIAVNDGYDSNDYIGTTGGMDVVMKCIVYGFYSKDLSQKIKTVLKAKAQKGQYIGSYAPYGFLKDPKDKHHLIPDPVAARIVKRIFSLALEMKTTGEIARILNDDHVETPAAHFKRLYPESKKFQKTTTAYNSWTCMNVYDILQRQEYTGAVVSQKKKYKGIEQPQTLSRDKKDWIIVPDCHEALVSKESFEAAQEAILKCGAYERKTESYLLRSLVRCGCCGRTMSRVKKGRNVGSFYKCDKNRYIENSPCPIGERFYEADLEKTVVQSLSQVLQVTVDEERRLQEAAAKTKGTAENLRREILRTEQCLKQNAVEKLQFYERYADGSLSKEEFLVIRNKIVQETESLEKEKTALEEQLSTLEQSGDTELKELAAEASSFLEADNVTNEMLRLFIDKVYVYSGMRIEIVYRFKNPFQAVERVASQS